MRLQKASSKAIKYAIMNWHYSKIVPICQCSFSVFNNANEWCGVICYSLGANKNISNPYGLTQGSVCELVRVALNGKQESTSKAVSLSISLLKKKCPIIKLIVSYADTEQGHCGTLYQATNWYYTGASRGSVPLLNGKKIHKRTYSSVHGSYSGVTMIRTKDKHKYIYPLDKSLIPLCMSLSKPYPKKNASEVLPVAQQTSSLKEGFDSTMTL